MAQIEGEPREYVRDGTIKGLSHFPKEAWAADEEPKCADFDIHGPHRLKKFKNRRNSDSLQTDSGNGSEDAISNLDVQNRGSSVKK
jgi:hypothetical protein